MLIQRGLTGDRLRSTVGYLQLQTQFAKRCEDRADAMHGFEKLGDDKELSTFFTVEREADREGSAKPLIRRKHEQLARKVQEKARDWGRQLILEQVMFEPRLKVILSSIAGACLWVGLTSTAQALLITTTGTTSGGSVSGSADFEIVGSTLEITLKNTTNPVNDIARVLDGLAFTLTGGSGVTLAFVKPNSDGSNAHNFEDCTGAGCVGVDAFHDYENNLCAGTNPVPSPYCWTFVGGLLSAGNGSYKPAGIVDANVTQFDGIPNTEHNDYLNGPVEFDFTFTTPPISVSNVSFKWGTTPESTAGTGPNGCTQGCVILPTNGAPEPGSLALVGLALSGLAWARRRFKS